ncbi:MAG: hypothetical protein IDH49_14860 [Gammaproteobacteria bacterium]|nr:hypothetical protein [Gammaproteobacteria bacterium]
MTAAGTSKAGAKNLVRDFGGRYSSALDIDLRSGKSGEVFKWFLASILFGARISQTIAINTYHAFEQAGVLSPQRIVDTGWDGLVAILDQGGYVRYDFKTATKLLDVNKTLLDDYGGDLNRLHADAANEKNLEARLKALGKGIGEVTVNIFLREMRGVWPKAQPLPADIVIAAAREAGFVPRGIRGREKMLSLLMNEWRDEGMKEKDFSDFEAALIRFGKSLGKKKSATDKGG